jgi:hypothetical protein
MPTEQEDRLWEFIKRHSGVEDRCGNPNWTHWFTGLGPKGTKYRQCKSCVHHYQVSRRVVRIVRKKPVKAARPPRDWAMEKFG